MTKLLGITVATIFFSSCASTSPDVLRGTKLLEERDFRGALQAFTEAISEDSTKAEAYLERSGAYLGLREYVLAIEDLTRSIELDSTSAKTFHARAYTEGLIGKYDLSFLDFARAIHLDSSDSEIFVNRANIQMDMQDTNAAFQDYSHALRLNPNDHLALLNRSRILRERRDSLGTFQDLSRAFDAEPNDFHNNLERGMAFLSFGNYPMAIADFNAVLAIDSTFADAYFGKGTSLFHKMEFEEALVYLNRSISLEPRDAEAYYYRALTYHALGNTGAACNDLTYAKALGFAIDFEEYNAICR